MMNCFELYYRPAIQYVRGTYEMATDDYGSILARAGLGLITTESIRSFMGLEFFGVPNLLIVVVVLTTFVDTGFGIARSLKKRKEYIKMYRETEDDSKKKRFAMLARGKKFSINKLQFTFFKVFTLLAYLYFAKVLMASDAVGLLEGVYENAAAALLKLPILLFWIKDFRSIGRNSEYLYGKKAPIFSIVDQILTIKLFKKLKKDEDNEAI